MNICDFVKPGALAVRGYAERLLKDVTPQMFARTPVVNGAVVTINHPAFVFGHLSLYPVQLAEMVGVSTQGMIVPTSYSGLFKIGAQCHDDAEGTIYPAMEELTSGYFASYDALLSVLSSIQSEKLNLPLENPARREKFGTVGAFMTYLLLAHPQGHLGQISGWRRCMGLGPA
jgi:hypothetical protein